MNYDDIYGDRAPAKSNTAMIAIVMAVVGVGTYYYWTHRKPTEGPVVPEKTPLAHNAYRVDPSYQEWIWWMSTHTGISVSNEDRIATLVFHTGFTEPLAWRLLDWWQQNESIGSRPSHGEFDAKIREIGSANSWSEQTD